MRPPIPGFDFRLGCYGHAGSSRSRSQGDGTDGEGRGRRLGLRQLLGSVGLSLPLLSAGAASAAEGDGPGPPQDASDADTGAEEVGVGHALLIQLALPVHASKGVLSMPGISPHTRRQHLHVHVDVIGQLPADLHEYCPHSPAHCSPTPVSFSPPNHSPNPGINPNNSPSTAGGRRHTVPQGPRHGVHQLEAMGE